MCGRMENEVVFKKVNILNIETGELVGVLKDISYHEVREYDESQNTADWYIEIHENLNVDKDDVIDLLDGLMSEDENNICFEEVTISLFYDDSYDDKSIIFEIWEDKKKDELTMCYSQNRENCFISKESVLLKSFEEPDYNKAMTIAHKFLGFEKYIPLDK